MIGSIVAALGGFAFIAVGSGALIAPAPSSAQYGLPTSDRAALALIRAVGARDVVLGAIVLLLLARGERGALSLVLGVSILAAGGDALAVRTGRDAATAGHAAVHYTGAGALLLAALLVRSGR